MGGAGTGEQRDSPKERMFTMIHRKGFLFFVTLAVLLFSLAILSGCMQKYRVVERYKGDAAKNLLLNKPWLDEYPAKPEQRFMAYVFTDESVGVHDKADSAYRHMVEIFLLKATADRINYLFPHDRRKADTAYKLERISGDRYFNLKVTIEQDPQSGGKTYIYFSNTEWNVKSERSMPENIRALSRVAHQ
jgi:hypothetical protein